MVLALLTKSLLFYLLLLGALVAGLLFSGVSGRILVRNFKPILILVAITFLYHILFSDRGGAELWNLFGFVITRDSVWQASFFSLRLLLFVAIAFLITLTNSPSELAEAMAKVLRPLERLGLPVGDLALILFIAIRFIPILYEEFMIIYNAQVIRGVDFSGNLLKRVKASTAVIVPVLVGAIARADDLALAMEARGYRSGRPRTFYSRSRMDSQAWLFMFGSGAAIGLLFYLIG